MGLITLIVLGILVCISLKCFLWCCQNSVETYSDWKRNKIRDQIETRKYFSSTLEIRLKKFKNIPIKYNSEDS